MSVRESAQVLREAFGEFLDDCVDLLDRQEQIGERLRQRDEHSIHLAGGVVGVMKSRIEAYADEVKLAPRPRESVTDVAVVDDSSSEGRGPAVPAAEDSLDRTLEDAADTSSFPCGGGAAGDARHRDPAAPEGGDAS